MVVSVSHSFSHFPLLQRKQPYTPQFQQIHLLKTTGTPSLKSSAFRCVSQLTDKSQIASLKPRRKTETECGSSLDSTLVCRVASATDAEVAADEEATSLGEARAVARNVRMSADKARRVIDQIRGLTYNDALLLLDSSPHRAALPILKVTKSAVANARNNLGLTKASFIISEAYVDVATTLKRIRFRARGRMDREKKRGCHITVVVKGQPGDPEDIFDVINNAFENLEFEPKED